MAQLKDDMLLYWHDLDLELRGLLEDTFINWRRSARRHAHSVAVHAFGECLCGCSDRLWAEADQLAEAAAEREALELKRVRFVPVTARATASWRRPPPWWWRA